MIFFKALILFLLAGGMSWFLTKFLITVLPHYGLMDIPNKRSSHMLPIPRGGGIAVVFSIMICWSLVVFMFGVFWPFFCVAGICLASAVSLIDDVRHVSPWWRLAIQFLAAIITIPYVDFYGNIFGGWMPAILDKTLAVIAWVAFMNFFNFMDGIDGISSVEACVVSVGVILLAFFNPTLHIDAVLACILMGATLGFFYWNKEPAKIFLGDVGSIALGFALGALLLRVAQEGYRAAAIILPMYYFMDAGITLLKRIVRKESIFQGHLGHFFQKAVLKGESHHHVSLAVGVVGIGCVLLALLSMTFPFISFVLAVILCSVFCVLLQSERISFSFFCSRRNK